MKEHITTELKSIAFDTITKALRATTSDDVAEAMTEVRILLKVVKTMVNDSIEMNMLYNDLMTVHYFVDEKRLDCAD